MGTRCTQFRKSRKYICFVIEGLIKQPDFFPIFLESINYFFLEMQISGLTKMIYTTSIFRTDIVTKYICPLLNSKLYNNKTTKQKY
jgi:hypothetical protein